MNFSDGYMTKEKIKAITSNLDDFAIETLCNKKRIRETNTQFESDGP